MIAWLSESVSHAPLGSPVSWRTPAGPMFGTVIGFEDKDLIVVTLVDKSLWQEPGEVIYRDEPMSTKLGTVRGLPRVRVDVHRIPKTLAFMAGKRLQGMQLKPYVRMVKDLYGPVKLGGKAKPKSKAQQALAGVFG